MRHPESYYPCQRDVDDYDDAPEMDGDLYSLSETPEGLGWEPVQTEESAGDAIEYRRAA